MQSNPDNQCDGCRQKLPLRDGNHYKDGRAWIGCTAYRYTEPTPTLSADLYWPNGDRNPE